MTNAMMVFYILALLFVPVNTTPLHKCIAQVIADSTVQWEESCNAAGGGQQCNALSVAAYSTLLATAGNCDQQNVADDMIDLAKTFNNDPMMIKLTQIFVQQPRDTPNSLAVPYCDTAPRNPELNGLFQCQFQSATLASFVGDLQDGSQLVDLMQDPGFGNSASSTSPVPAAPIPASSSASSLAPVSNTNPTSTSQSSSSNSSSGLSPSSSTDVTKWVMGICMFIILLLKGGPLPSFLKSGVPSSVNEVLEVVEELNGPGEPASSPISAVYSSSTPSNPSTLVPSPPVSLGPFSAPLSSLISPNVLLPSTLPSQFVPPSLIFPFMWGSNTFMNFSMVQHSVTQVSFDSHTSGVYVGRNWEKAARLV